MTQDATWWEIAAFQCAARNQTQDAMLLAAGLDAHVWQQRSVQLAWHSARLEASEQLWLAVADGVAAGPDGALASRTFLTALHQTQATSPPNAAPASVVRAAHDKWQARHLRPATQGASTTLAAVVLIAAPLAQHIPLAVLAGVLLFVAWNMGEWREFVRLRTFRLPYRVILLSVFVLTVVVDLTVAVEVGIFFACFIFIYRISSLSTAEPAQLPDNFASNGVAVYKLTGALFFGAVQFIESLLVNVPERALVLDFSSVIYIDSSGEESLEELLELYQEKGIPILVYGLR